MMCKEVREACLFDWDKYIRILLIIQIGLSQTKIHTRGIEEMEFPEALKKLNVIILVVI